MSCFTKVMKSNCLALSSQHFQAAAPKQTCRLLVPKGWEAYQKQGGLITPTVPQRGGR